MNDAPINKFEASDPHRHPRDDEFRNGLQSVAILFGE